MNYNNYKKALQGLFFYPLFCLFFLSLLFPLVTRAQATRLNWQNRTQDYGPLPAGMELYSFEGNYNNKPFRAFYAIADPGSGSLQVEHDTTKNRRITPSAFYKKNGQPAMVVNTSFFSFKDNLNLNIIVNKGKILAYNQHSVAGRGVDSGLYRHPFVSALGITTSGKMDVAWTFTASNKRKPFATQFIPLLHKDSIQDFSLETAKSLTTILSHSSSVAGLKRWKMQTVIGGGPVLVQQSRVSITNNEEWKFPGKAINDAHPRTAIGYTKDGKLIVLVIEGRNPGVAAGATLPETASILVALGCLEALNLDGGGSSCMLINGRETIRPSDKEGQRPIPAAMVWKQR